MRKILFTIIWLLALFPMELSAQTYSSDRNYIATRTYVATGKYRDAVSYFDEQGRPLQQIAVSHTPSGASLLTYFEYDVSDKEVTRMSPIPDSGNGNFRKNFYGYFQNEAENPYGSSRYLPFSRVSYDWGTGTKVTELRTSKGSRPQEFSYASNDTKVHVPRFEIVSDGLRRIGTYPEGEIRVSKRKDENGNVSMTFTDRRGRTVMTRSMDSGENLDICYVYDNLDNLRYVLPPECVERSYGTQYDRGETLGKFAYINRYDSYGRLIYAKKPSIEPVYLVYDKSGKLVFMQDGNLREQNRWCFSLVDRLGRTAISGVCANQIDYLNPGDISESVVRAVRQDDGEFCGYAVEGINLNAGEVLCASFYDDYSFLDLGRFSPLKSRHYTDGSSVVGLQTGTYNASVGAEGTDGWKVTSVYYDEMSRPAKTVSWADCGIFMTITQTYNLIDQPLVKTVSYDGNLNKSLVSKTICTYDNGDRLVCEQTSLTGFDNALVRYEYDEVDRLKTEILGEGTGAIFSHCTYDERNRLLSKSNPVFQYSLSYDKPENVGSAKRYDGSVSETSWRGGQNGGLNTYSFHYDGLDRFTDTDRYSDGDKIDEYVEKNVGYNRNSGMTGIVRYYDGTADSLSFSYDGALMDKALVNGKEYSFSYDHNGNLIHDGRNGIDISYDINNQMSEVSLAGVSKVSYRHFSDGTKYSMKNAEGLELKYLGPAVFKKSGSSYALESLAFSAGRFEAEGMENMPCYYLTDHLGSVRAMASVTAPDASLKSEPVVWCLSDYFPFGLRWGDGVNTRSRYQFNGKENQSKYGAPYLDYGARMYDNYLCRWTACDPVIDYAYDGYSFCHGNPVNMVDPDGLSVYYVDGERNEIDDGDDSFSMNVSQKELNGLKWRFRLPLKFLYARKRNKLSLKHGFTTAEVDNALNPNGPRGSILTYHAAGKESYLSYQAGGSWMDDAAAIVSTGMDMAGSDALKRINVGEDGKWFYQNENGLSFYDNPRISSENFTVKYGKILRPLKQGGKIIAAASNIHGLANVKRYENGVGMNTLLLLSAQIGGWEGGGIIGDIAGGIGISAGICLGPEAAVAFGLVFGAVGGYIGGNVIADIISGEL